MTKTKKLKLFISLLLAIYIIGSTGLLIADKLAGGGRWGVSMFVVMAKRFLDGEGLFYSDAQTGFLTSPFYFPGGTFIAILVQLVFNHGVEGIMILIASAIGVMTLFLFVCIAGDNRKHYLIPALVIFPLFFKGFDYLRSYVAEMHPDMPVLFFGAIAAIVVARIAEDEADKWYRYVLLIFLLLCSGVFKQNAVMIFLGFGITILFTKNLNKQKKLKLLASVFIAGILVLLVIFGIDGCFEATVQVMSRHDAVPAATFKGYIKNSFTYNKIFVGILAAFFILLITRNIKLSFVQKLWLVSGLIWFAFNIYGTKKDGSNEGNVDVALIVLAPFVGMAVQEVYYKIKEHVHFDERFASEWEKAPLLICCICIVFVATMIPWAKSTYAALRDDKAKYNSRKQDEHTVTAWLNENCPDGSIAIYSHYYFWLKDADVNINTDFYTMDAYVMARMTSLEDIEELYNKYKWDIIIFNDEHLKTPPSEWDFANYELLEGESISDIIPMDIYRRVQ